MCSMGKEGPGDNLVILFLINASYIYLSPEQNMEADTLTLHGRCKM